MIYGQSGTKYVPLTAQLEIEVIVPLSISKEANLSFGFASPGNGTGYVTILPAENPQRTASGVATLLPSGSGIVSAAKFRVTGAPGAQVNISVPDSFPLYHQGGTTSVNLNLTGSSNSLQLGPAGDGVFYVGGTVTMGRGQSLGVYSGTFNVTVCNN